MSIQYKNNLISVDLPDWKKSALSFNIPLSSDTTSFSFQRNNAHTLDFFQNIFLQTHSDFFLVDYLFFIETNIEKCPDCVHGFNTETNIIYEKNLKRFNTFPIKFSDIEIDYLLKNNLIKIPNFNLFYNDKSDFWYYIKDEKKVLVQKPKLPSKKEIEHYFNDALFVDEKIIKSLTQLLANSLGVFGYCNTCNNKPYETSNNQNLYLKLSYFDRLSSSLKNVFFRVNSEEDFEICKKYIIKNKKKSC